MQFLAHTALLGMSLLANKPPPLAPADGPHTFTYDTVHRRLPLIVESVISNNDYPETLVADLKALAAEIAAGKPLKPLAAPSQEWDTVLKPLLEISEL